VVEPGILLIRVAPNYAITANNRASTYENRRDDDRVIQEVNQTIGQNGPPPASPKKGIGFFFGARD
jgi:hypothetical protein